MLKLPTHDRSLDSRRYDEALGDRTRVKILVLDDGPGMAEIADMADACAAGESEERVAIWVTDVRFLGAMERARYRADSCAVCVLDFQSEPRAWLTQGDVRGVGSLERAVRGLYGSHGGRNP